MHVSSLDEYAETVVADGFKRQLDQEENVVRSLPFVVAGVGLIGTLLTTYRPAMCKFDAHSLLSIGMYAAAWGMGAASFCILMGLVLAVWRRTYEYPMDEVAFLDFVTQTVGYYRRAGAPQDEAEAAALKDARAAITKQLADSAHANRPNNQARDYGRSIALNGLAALMVLGAVIICLVSWRHIVAPGACHG